MLHLALAALHLLMVCSPVIAQDHPPGGQQGRLYLWDTPTRARVYLDDRPIVWEVGRLAKTAPGRHVLQIEEITDSGLKALRMVVQIRASDTTTVEGVPHRLRPVELAFGEEGREWISVPGEAGPEGEAGPPALPMRPLPNSTDPLVLREILEAGAGIVLDDFERQIERLQNRARLDSKQIYLYRPVRLTSRPPGPAGPPGPPGRAGIPAEVFLLQSPDGERLIDLVKRGWQRDLGAKIADLERRLTALGGMPSEPPRIDVLTPEWRAQLDKTRAHLLARKRPSNAIVDDFGIMGHPGPQGPRGPDGIPPPGVSPIRLTKEEADAVLSALVTMPTISTRTTALLSSLQEIEQRIQFAETDREVSAWSQK